MSPFSKRNLSSEVGSGFFNKEGYLDGYRTIKKYSLVPSTGMLAYSENKGNKRLLSVVLSKEGIENSWNPDYLPKWITNFKHRYVDENLVSSKEYTCRLVEAYKNYLEVQ